MKYDKARTISNRQAKEFEFTVELLSHTGPLQVFQSYVDVKGQLKEQDFEFETIDGLVNCNLMLLS